ncbi:MAG: hypothetical protein WC869_01725 [Phycisphaerae bacterium]|jgi:chromosome segregation ATPase
MWNKSLIVVVAVIGLGLSGCNAEEPSGAGLPKLQIRQPSAQSKQAAYLSKSAVQKDASVGGETAVDSALAWAEKYSQASAKNEVLQREKADLLDKNAKLQIQMATLQADLSVAQRELKEANTMLLDIRTDLDKWKSNVLGYRQEMRAAQQVQLQQLSKILKILGAEPAPSGTTASKPAAPEKEGESEPLPQ